MNPPPGRDGFSQYVQQGAAVQINNGVIHLHFHASAGAAPAPATGWHALNRALNDLTTTLRGSWRALIGPPPDQPGSHHVTGGTEPWN
ncbi:hypothetical protein ABT093_22650 [Kitasatospora sp. NPDC002551]|uniref:hypothetical protein n=1 Tax=Kitasatospora sp. NPDC002551 TaxID=3154539 RepID=UPI003321B980